MALVIHCQHSVLSTNAWYCACPAGGLRYNHAMNDPLAAAAAKPVIAFDDWQRIDVRAGTIVEAMAFPEARKPAIKLVIDFGPAIGRKQSSAQITAHYDPAMLIGRQVAAVVNFAPRQIGKFRSEVLTLGFPDAGGEVVLIAPEQPVPDGGALF